VINLCIISDMSTPQPTPHKSDLTCEAHSDPNPLYKFSPWPNGEPW